MNARDATPGFDVAARLGEALGAIAAGRDGTHAANLKALLAGMATYGNLRGDPVRTLPAYLGDRWSSLVMHLLHGGMLRHAELRRLIQVVSAEHEISQRMLTLKLRVLERDGLIARTVTTDVPPHVEYRLTPLGQAGYAHFAALLRWAEQSSAAIRAARQAYDHGNPDAAELLRDASGCADD